MAQNEAHHTLRLLRNLREKGPDRCQHRQDGK
jgi:hypothetical protein